MEITKMSPQSIESEVAVLGTCLSYPDRVTDALAELRADMFYKVEHQRIFDGIHSIVISDRQPDIITLKDFLNKHNIDVSLSYIMELVSSIVSDKMFNQHILFIKEKFILREYIRTGHELINMAYDENIDNVIEFAESRIMSISQETRKKEPILLDVVLDDVISNIKRVAESTDELIGVPSGFTSLDRVTSGFNNSDLIILAARPSMGKTALALQFGLNSASLGYTTALFSLEMSQEQLAQRYISGVSDYTNVEIKTGRVDIEHIIDKSGKLLGLPLYIDDTPSISVFEMKSKLKKLKHKNGIKFAIVDYLQLMSGTQSGNREQEISSISRGLKMIAKELNIPILALSQLNRGVEARADKKPMLSDLRESGAIEQDADMVMMIYRPAYYGISEIYVDKKNQNTEGVMMIGVEKNRNGATCTRMFYHNKSLTNIVDDKFNL